MVGLVEALDFLGEVPENVQMLSLSTTTYPFRLDNWNKLRGRQAAEDLRYDHVRPGSIGREHDRLLKRAGVSSTGSTTRCSPAILADNAA